MMMGCSFVHKAKSEKTT